MAESHPVSDFTDSVRRRDLLLKTKLYIPPTRPDRVPRPHLVARLKDGLTRPLILVSAPAGFGKTTLLSEWISSSSHNGAIHAAWISLDERDNDPHRFWTLLIAALATLNVHDIENILSPLDLAESLSEENLIALLDKIVTDVPDDFILVFDDYHLISLQVIHNALIFLLNHCPPHMHMVIVSRTDPPFPLAKFRSRDMLVELRANDLRFTPDEVAAFLNKNMNFDLSSKAIELLQERTEGWIAGLQLAALSMRDRKDLTSFIQAFNGSQHFIVDYLAEQVLDQQPQEIQDFLLETSILERLTDSLCDSVTGQEHSQVRLEWLERSNLFLVPLDDERRWYRYHQLFADFLRGRLRQIRPNDWVELHRRAAEWCERNGLIEEAIRYSLEAKETDRVECLIEQVMESFWQRSEMLTLFSWMKALPEGLVHSRPGLCIYAGWAFALAGRLDAVEPFLESVESYLDKAEPSAENLQSDVWLSAADILRAFVARFQGDVSRAIDYSRRALGRATTENMDQRGHALLSLGHAYFLDGNMEAAQKALREAIAVSQTGGYVAVYLSATNYLAQVYVMQGRLSDAQFLFQQADNFVAEQEAPHPTGVNRVGIGDLQREWNDLDEASRNIYEGLNLVETSGDLVFVREGYFASARLELARGDYDSALSFIMRVEQIARRSPGSMDLTLTAIWQARLYLLQGDIKAAEQWLQDCEPAILNSPDILREFWKLIKARLLLAQGKPADAVQLLSELLPPAESTGRVGRVIEISLLQAQALRVQGNFADSLAALQRSLALAEPGGYVRLFVDEGDPIHTLLAESWHQLEKLAPTRLVGYLDKLLRAFPSKIISLPLSIQYQSQELAEPLSERELQILRLIAAGKSYLEIAQELVIALSTVQSYIRKIYPKLDAHSGLEAVSRARQLNLL